ncbi:hypothetical protein [Fervidibacter sacchari]
MSVKTFRWVIWFIVAGTSSLAGATGLEDFAHTRFFEAHCATNDEKFLLACWRSWLQNYRAVLKNPSLARSLERRKPKFKLFYDDILPMLNAQQVRKESTHIYTLQIAAFERTKNAREFLQKHWRDFERYRVYQRIPKGFVLECACAERYLPPKEPIYSVWKLRGGRKLFCLRYGVYATRSDAEKDKKVLERFLRCSLLILRCQLTVTLVIRVWEDPTVKEWIEADFYR